VLVATVSFTDPTDGQPIVAGRTYVARNADVARMFPENFKKAPSRIDGGGLGIVRRGGASELVDRPRPKQARKRRHAISRAQAPQRPAWLLEEPEPWRL
jgi:hypothetical protein